MAVFEFNMYLKFCLFNMWAIRVLYIYCESDTSLAYIINKYEFIDNGSTI